MAPSHLQTKTCGNRNVTAEVYTHFAAHLLKMVNIHLSLGSVILSRRLKERIVRNK